MQNDYKVVSRNSTQYPDKMDVMAIPPLVCRDVKQTKRRFNAVNGNSFTTAGAEVRIPISGNFILDNKNVNLNLKITAAGTAGKLASADFSWAGLFSQIRVEAGNGSSIVLEQIDDPGLWANMLYQYTWHDSDLTIQNAKQLSVASQPGVTAGTISKTGGTLTIGTTNFFTIAMDLSQILGLFSATTGLPLYDTSGITVVCVLNTQASMAVFDDAATTLTLSDFFITATCLEGGEAYEKQLKEEKNKQGEVSLMFNTCRRYVQNLSGGAAITNTQLLINDRTKSCLGFVAMSRTTADITTIGKYKNSSSAFPVYISHAYQIAGINYPVSMIGTDGEALDEVYDLYSHLSRRKEAAGLINRAQGGGSAIAASVDIGAVGGPSNVLAVNLAKCGPQENYWGKGMNISGNLSNSLVVSYTPPANTTVTIFSVFQMKVHIDKMGNFSTEF
jgi:hypothetical protein